MTRLPRIRALIVDDEQLARERIASFLVDESDIEVVGEAASGSAAVMAIADKRPDLVFLDVQMPGLDGFGVLRSIARSYAPVIVFVTAHDEYAIRAFEVQAADYLLKPVSAARFHAATQRAIARVRTAQREGSHTTSNENSRVIAGILEQIPMTESGPRIPVKRDGGIDLVAVAAIDWIEARGDYLEIHAGKQTHRVRQSLTEFAELLPSGEFLRVHRSVVVRITRVSSVNSVLRGGYELTLSNDQKIRAGRTYRDIVRTTFLRP